MSDMASSSPAAESDTLLAANRLGRRSLGGLVAWQLARNIVRLGFLGAAALLIGRLVMGSPVTDGMLLAVPALLALAALTGLTTDRTQAQAETRLAAELRALAEARLRDMPARALRALPVGDLVVSLQRHPEAVAALAIGHRAATVMLAIGPLAAACALLIVSWQAALMVLGLTPVMIVFFVLVGTAIRRQAEAQERAFGRLAGQFADRLRSLPTIIANHALVREEAKLGQRLDTHAAKTMRVLGIAFLNAGIIDFFTSLSIAMLAVLLGLGHLKLLAIPGFSDLALWQSLFILMIAPDYFVPFRRYAEQYHAKAEGLAAASALDRLLAMEAPPAPVIAAVEQIAAMPELPARGLVALWGPSGAGKSTLLRRIAGVEISENAPQALLAGAPLTWIATDSFIPEGRLADAIAWNTGAASPARVLMAAGQVGLLDDRLLPGGLDATIANGGANLSGGQRIRIALARALVADGPVIADEPTAKLDAECATAIRAALKAMARNRLVLVATHDGELLKLAERRIEVANATCCGMPT